MTGFVRHAITLAGTMIIMGTMAWLAGRQTKSPENIYRVVLPFRFLCVAFIGLFASMAISSNGSTTDRFGMLIIGLVGVAIFSLFPFLQYELTHTALRRKLLLWQKTILLTEIVSCKQSSWEDSFIIKDINGRKMNISMLISGHKDLVAEIEKIIKQSKNSEPSSACDSITCGF